MFRSFAIASATIALVGLASAPDARADDWQQSFLATHALEASTRQSPGKGARRGTSASAKAARAKTERAQPERAQGGTRLASVEATIAKKTVRAIPRARSSDGVESTQYGIASFYWQPQRLATGGYFNPDAMTAAHRYLPFWSRVRVTHLGNGRSVEVVINDRGPFIAGRIIDLSRAAAGVIGMRGQGVAQVRVEVLRRGR